MDLEGVPVATPIGIQVADLLGRDLDPYGAVRPHETVKQLVGALAMRLHGDGRSLMVAPSAFAIRPRISGPKRIT